MSNKPNHRRAQGRIQDHGPTWENPTPAAGCNSTHVARARAAWKRIKNRSERRSGRTTPKFRQMKLGRPVVCPPAACEDDE